jgi:hypothetical protein
MALRRAFCCRVTEVTIMTTRDTDGTPTLELGPATMPGQRALRVW